MLLALAALLVVAVPAGWARELRVQTGLNSGGRTGWMAVTRSPFESIGWDACTSKLTECRPWSRGSKTETLGAPAGTVFRVKNSEGRVGLSPEWRGPLKELAPPRVAGVTQANEYVSPVPGLWGGGWRGEPSEMQLSACETEAGQGCVSITSPHFIRQGCDHSASFYLNPRFTGWYLRVADQQSGGPHLEAGYAVFSPSGATWGFDEVWRSSRTVSVAMVGQVAPAMTPPAGECGPSPAPTATISAEGIARVECGGGCSVSLIASCNGRRSSVERHIPSQDLLRTQAVLEMQLPPSVLSGIGDGKVRLMVDIDGTRLAQRTVRTPNA
jgi:hypothetical protein